MYRCKLFINSTLCDQAKSIFRLEKIPEVGLVVENDGNKYKITSINETTIEVDGVTTPLYELTGVSI